MKICLFSILIAVFAVQKCKANCEESRELESTCGKYCFKVVRPFLQHAKMFYSQTEENEKSNTLQSLSDNINELSKTLKAEMLSINREIRLIKQKLEPSEEIDKYVKEFNSQTGAKDNTEFEKIGEKYYYIENKQKLSWFSALIACQKMGGHLASLENDSESIEIGFRLSGLPGTPYWVDVNDIVTEGKYMSSTTSLEVKYLKWKDSEPSDNNDQDCVGFDYFYDMSNYNCWEKFNFICEKSS
ncbi:accessory gland protein Acp29AB-like [Drosophila sulfurigaster albostrigata]|uniref:accessory gland protein Acp29AB-like n=1 Tax=Drosophila sulfurigaster albostrigata TaxID=89887 RepID=UPI002D21CBA0|nr:accessory gland protein Acp29AB-like [Drosophila sulfurigaster albostrigata]